MSGAGQETRPFGAFRNVHEVDTAILRHTWEFALDRTSCILCLSISCLRSWAANMHSAETVKAHTSRVQEVPRSTHTFLILPLDAASCAVTMAGTKSSREGCFLEGGSVLYLVSLSSAAETAESQLGRENERSNIRRDVQGPEISRPAMTTCPEMEGEMLYCSPLSSSFAPTRSIPHY